jgi:hypothetical protein
MNKAVNEILESLSKLILPEAATVSISSSLQDILKGVKEAKSSLANVLEDADDYDFGSKEASALRQISVLVSDLSDKVKNI